MSFKYYLSFIVTKPESCIFETMIGRTIFFLLFLIASSVYGQSEISFDEIKVNSREHPVYFDLRTTSYLSEIKVQPTGGCWSSSTLATVEAWWRILGYGNYVLSDKNLQLNHGYSKSRNVYGNHFMATAYFSRLSGPVIKSPELDSVKFVRYESPYFLTGARFIPPVPEMIKQTLLDFGPVYTMLNFKRKDVDTLTHILYARSDRINHAVVLTGWNDTVQTDIGEGVWIAQNSLGVKFGDSGFFYIPFENEEIIRHNAVWNEWSKSNENLNLHYYDTLGSYNSYGFNDSICYGLVRFTMKDSCRLKKVGLFINEPLTDIEITLYESFDTASKTVYNQKGRIVRKHCPFPGYYTVDIPDRLLIGSGQDVFVMVRYSNPISTQPLPVENFIKNYCDPHITTHKCWINPNFEKWPNTWYECGEHSPYGSLLFDLCIRIYTESIHGK